MHTCSHRHIQVHTDRQREREREREKDILTDRETDRQTETDGESERERDHFLDLRVASRRHGIMPPGRELDRQRQRDVKRRAIGCDLFLLLSVHACMHTHIHIYIQTYIHNATGPLLSLTLLCALTLSLSHSSLFARALSCCPPIIPAKFHLDADFLLFCVVFL